jgi:outer membrane protein OmpA-like peptidoglycan-associated protein
MAEPEPAPAPPAKIVLDEAVLHFANDKAVLRPEGVEAVRKVADSLKAYSGKYTLVVTGHTSKVGTAAYNKALSKRRADAVAKVLEDEGIPADSVQTVGMGFDQPLDPGTSKEAQARNRRVEIDVKTENADVETRKTVTSLND